VTRDEFFRCAHIEQMGCLFIRFAEPCGEGAVVDAGDAEAGRNGLGALPGDGVGLGTDWVRFVARPVLEFQTSEAPALRTACEGENAIGNPCVDQRLRADYAAGGQVIAPGT